MTHPFPLAAVIGHPIAHSRSPRLHRHWLAHYGLTGDYTALDIATDALEPALRSLPALGFQGVNLTIPHKLAGLQIADHVTDAARQIGAANTLVFQRGEIFADNTDGYGFIANLGQGAPQWRPDGPALILGAGGAARAVIHALIDAGLPEIRLTNRSPEKAAALADHFGPTVTPVPWAARGDSADGADLLVNTTSLGMQGQPALDMPLDALPIGAVVTDLVYAPLETPLLAAARARGNSTVDGLGMLLHQGVPGFERWFGTRPQVTPALRAAVLA